MFNFQNLNDYEFELLCKDLLELELNIKLRTYAKGKDGGIDISGLSAEDIIIQVKHYINSPFSSLKSSLKKELFKVKAKAPKKYYLCISNRLTPNNIQEIYKLFADYMISPASIYDGVRIDNILESHIDIVKKHYKLWLTSSNILELINNKEVFIDTDELLLDIQSDINLFVETKAYHDSIRILNNNNVIIILGSPGVGKTTISKMLILHYAEHNYKARYASNNSVKDLKKVISQDTEREVLLLDDFLGQHYLSLRENRPNELKALISHIMKSSSKKLILNSRITIFNEALRRSQPLNVFLEDHEVDQYIIDLDKMSIIEKAKIFYNHIYFHKLPKAYFNELKIDYRYLSVVKHENYNPRIIEYVTKPANYNKISSDGYYDYVTNKLSDPSDIWHDEFNERIDTSDRIFMHTLFSLSEGFILETILQECYNNRIRNEKAYDTTKNIYSECLTRLSESMIRIIEEKGAKKIGVLNPSINDYIHNRLSNNENEIDLMLKNAVYVDQINRLSSINLIKAQDYKIALINNGTFMELKTMHSNINYQFLECVYENEYKNPKVRKLIIELLSKPETFLNTKKRDASRLVCNILSNINLIEYYSLNELILNLEDMEPIFNIIVLDDMSVFLSIYEVYYIKSEIQVDALKEKFDKYIISEIEEEVEEKLHATLHETIQDVIEDDAYNKEVNDYINGYEQPLINAIKIVVEDETNVVIEEIKNENYTEYYQLENIEVSISAIIDYIDYETEINGILEPDDKDYYDDYRDYHNGKSSQENEVHHIFNRDIDL